ncbi:MAG: porin family protein [Calditrichaceae bacterium]|jgi:hypothetical protein
MIRYVVIFIIIFSGVTNAQFLKNYGFKLGVTSSKEDWKYSELGKFNTDSKAGLNISAFAEVLDLPYVNLVSEIGYDQKGMKTEVPITSVTQPEGTGKTKTMHNRVDYLDFSLALKLNYAMPAVTPYVFAGPRADFLIGSNVDPGYEIVYDDYENVVYGLNLGLGTEIGNILPVSVLAEFQYNYDLSHAYKTDNLKINNHSYEFKIGIML